MAKRVVVVGGGVSGLVTAEELAKLGCEVILLEAKDRLGGRILTHANAGVITELGAEFIHGCGEKILKTIREAGLDLAEASQRNRVWKNGALHEVDLWT